MYLLFFFAVAGLVLTVVLNLAEINPFRRKSLPMLDQVEAAMKGMQPTANEVPYDLPRAA